VDRVALNFIIQIPDTHQFVLRSFKNKITHTHTHTHTHTLHKVGLPMMLSDFAQGQTPYTAASGDKLVVTKTYVLCVKKEQVQLSVI
jgi:hypothetical protein